MSKEDLAKQLVIKSIVQVDKEAIVALGNLLDQMRSLINAHSAAIKQLATANEELRTRLTKLESKEATLAAKDAIRKLSGLF